MAARGERPLPGAVDSAATCFGVDDELAGQTLAGALRVHASALSWGQARRLIAQRQVRVNGAVCTDDARRLAVGDQIDARAHATSAPAPQHRVQIIYFDPDIVVVEKPAGLQTVRRPEERGWSAERRLSHPVLQEVVERLLADQRSSRGRASHARRPAPVRAVHRLDQDTSGIMLFARTGPAEQVLERRFADHDIERVYQAVVHGHLRDPATYDSWLVRDRGDGTRGSAAGPIRAADARRAVTHVRPLRAIGDAYALVECRLETGRTHQIRIHLAENGHMLCGERRYTCPRPGAQSVADASAAPRQALHSMSLKFLHPITERPLEFQSAWPVDMMRWMVKLETADRGGDMADNGR